MDGGQRVGEVVEASTSRFVVQCHELYGAPPLGSLVRSEGGVYGVVAEVTTQSLDPGRRAVAMGRGEDSAEAVYRRHPQLTRLMSTELEAVVVAHRGEGGLSRFLAPTPPRIHEIVHACGGPELVEVAGELELLPSLLASPCGFAGRRDRGLPAAACRCASRAGARYGWRRAGSWRGISRGSFTA